MAQLTLQPAESVANDSRIANGALANNNYDTEGLQLRAPKFGAIHRSLLAFDLTQIPAGSKIGLATLSLYFYEGQPSPVQEDGWRVYRCTRPGWLDSAVTWNKWDGVSSWTTPGGDYDAGSWAVGSAPESPCWREVDLTTLAQDAVDNRDGLLNLLVKMIDESPPTSTINYLIHDSDDKADLRPKLEVTYAPPLLVTEGPESLVPFLTTPIAGAEQADPRQSLGGWRSEVRAELLGWRVRPPAIRGLAIEYVSPACRSGVARIQAVGVDQAALAAPGHELGPPVTLAADQPRVLVSAGDPAAYVRVCRYGSEALAGVTELELQPGWNNVLCGSNLTVAEQGTGTDRVHLVLFVAHGSGKIVKDVRVWTKKLGTEQVIANAGLAGLPASGAGRFKLASTADWHPHTRYILVTAPGGDTANPKEILCGHLDGDEFVVPASGRAVYSIGSVPSADGDLVFPFCGVRLAGEKTASGSLPGGWPVADEKTVPGGQSWRYGLGPANPPAGGGAVGWLLAPGDVTRLGIWVHLEIPAGYKLSAVVPVSLCWRYTVDDDDGQPVTYVFESEGLFRWAGDVDVYQAFRSVDGAEIDYGSPVAVNDTLPFNAPVVDDAANRLEVWKYNQFGLGAKIGDETFVIAGGAEVTGPPADPVWLALRQTGAKEIVVSALYRPPLDPNPADYWHVAITNLSTPGSGESSDETIEVVGQALATLAAVKSHVDWAEDDELQVQVRMKRSADAAYSSYLTKTITLAGLAPAEPAGGQSFVAGRRGEF